MSGDTGSPAINTADSASIEVEREFDGLTDHLREYEVVIDGEVVGRLSPGEVGTFEVAPGFHEIFMKIDWARSEKINVHLTEGQAVQFHCAPRANLFTGLYWASFGYRRYIKLTRAVGIDDVQPSGRIAEVLAEIDLMGIIEGNPEPLEEYGSEAMAILRSVGALRASGEVVDLDALSRIVKDVFRHWFEVDIPATDADRVARRLIELDLTARDASDG